MKVTEQETGYFVQGERAYVSLFPNEAGFQGFHMELLNDFDLKVGAIAEFKVVEIQKVVTDRG